MSDTKEVVELDPITLEPSESGMLYLKTTRESGAVALEAISDEVKTIRISDQKVVDITYTFDVDAMDYVEVSRTERDEPLPETPEQKIARLESDNADLKGRVSDMELAFADIIAGGGV